jgi:hypothetical protein
VAWQPGIRKNLAGRDDGAGTGATTILLDVNKASILLLEKFGFERWGHFPGIVEFADKTSGQLI